jgi:hypothetical protein
MSNKNDSDFAAFAAPAVMAAILYVAAFGPVCWLNERELCSAKEVGILYRPILALASRGRLPQPFGWYARAGATDRAEAHIEFGEITWSNCCRSGLKKINLALPKY